jgi:hypothetical protein
LGYSLTWEHRGFHVTYSGKITSKDVMNVINEIQGDSRFDALRYGISEYLNVESYEITPAQLMIHVAHWNGSAQSNPNMVLASVTTHQKILELLQANGKVKHQRKIFSTLQEARNWLASEKGIPQPSS